MVNDESVSMKESMKAARHSSVDAHLGYIEEGKVSEENRITSLLVYDTPHNQTFVVARLERRIWRCYPARKSHLRGVVPLSY